MHSGAVSAGSNPAGGTGQNHKLEHSDNLERLQCQRCDLRKRGHVPDLAPYTCPTANGRTGELPAQQHHTLTVPGPKTGRCSCADTATKRRWPSPQAPAHTRPAWRTGQPVPPAGYWHRRANRSITECDRTTLAASACNRRYERLWSQTRTDRLACRAGRYVVVEDHPHTADERAVWAGPRSGYWGGLVWDMT